MWSIRSRRRSTSNTTSTLSFIIHFIPSN
jgi:hypothetical protein